MEFALCKLLIIIIITDTYRPIEGLHGGHVGWQEQYNYLLWETKSIFMQIFFTVPSIQHGCHATPLYYSYNISVQACSVISA